MEIADLINLGKYQWRVLDISGNRALLLTDQIVEQRDYHNRKEETTWEKSEIRHYLNTGFLENFSSSERGRIMLTHNINVDNPWYPSHAGNSTEDRVFLLSLDEVVRLYFGDSSRLLDNPKPNQRYWFDRKDENNCKRRALLLGSSWWWWTRTPGKHNRVATYVHGDGNIGIQGNGICKTSFNTLHKLSQSNKGGVRPAMWINAS